jgi:hypothetical protein
MTERRNQSEVCQGADRTTLDLVEFDDGASLTRRAVNARQVTQIGHSSGRVTGRLR